MKNIELYIIIILLVTIGILEEMHRYDHREAKLAKENLAISSKQWQDEKGRYISEVGNMTSSISTLKDIFQKDSSQLSSSYEKRIYGLKSDLNVLGVRYKDLLASTGGIVTVRDTFITKFVKKDTVLVANHTDGYLTENFRLERDFTMKTDYTYKDSITVMDIRKPKLKSNGKKHWPNWGNLPWVGWETKTLWYSNNPKAKFSGVYSLKIER